MATLDGENTIIREIIFNMNNFMTYKKIKYILKNHKFYAYFGHYDLSIN